MTIMTPYWTRQNLASNLADLWNEIDRAYDDRHYTPATDVVEAEDHFLMSMDVPGLKKEDIKIEIQDKMLTVSGERRSERKNSNRSYSFKRSFTLPDSVSGEKIEAHYEDGVLDLYLPKAPAAQPRKIEIQSEKTGFFEKLLSSKKTATEMKNVSNQ